MTNTTFRSALRSARIAVSLLLLSLAASAQVTKQFRINGTASANSDFAWGYTQAQVVCVTGPAQGSPPSAFVTLFVASINAVTPNAASITGPDSFAIRQATNFEFWVSSGCPAMHQAAQKVTGVGGAPISFNPTIQEVLALPIGVPVSGKQGLCLLAGGVILAALLVLRRRGLG